MNPVVHAVLDTGPKFQVHVARLLAERYEEAAADPVLRHRVTRVRNALRGMESTEGQPREARATLMRVLADREVHHDTGELVRLAESEFAEAVNSPETSSR
ncbi:hypothetical protein ACFWOB_40515 [Streptomyces sp. NPDC058420]|uniref:hypothetical protein n=1 Tax=Streptomyces sp. NPDC058420 TaxID=3346489 RepID=UPI00364A1D59